MIHLWSMCAGMLAGYTLRGIVIEWRLKRYLHKADWLVKTHQLREAAEILGAATIVNEVL